MNDTTEPSDHIRIRRSDRARYDLDTVKAILDEATFCHVGFVDGERPVVVPMLHSRVDDAVLLHGSPATRLFRLLKTGPEVCITATLLDGLVLARSAFHHSANYRSVVVFGRPRPVVDLDERRRALDALTDRLVPGRRPHLRPMSDKEVRATAMVTVPLDAASAKVRTGPPIDDEEDRNWPVWTGVLPIVTSYGEPLPDTPSTADLPDHLRQMIDRG